MNRVSPKIIFFSFPILKTIIPDKMSSCSHKYNKHSFDVDIHISDTGARVKRKKCFITTCDTSGKFQKQIHTLPVRVDRYSTLSSDDHDSSGT